MISGITKPRKLLNRPLKVATVRVSASGAIRPTRMPSTIARTMRGSSPNQRLREGESEVMARNVTAGRHGALAAARAGAGEGRS